MQRTISIQVSGKVQGVFFRQSTREFAKGIGINGYVKNLEDGRVSIVATGTKEQIDKLMEWCRVGPPKAKVTTIEATDLTLQHFDGFSINR